MKEAKHIRWCKDWLFEILMRKNYLSVTYTGSAAELAECVDELRDELIAWCEPPPELPPEIRQITHRKRKDI
jgi:hypothetical protein